MTFFSYDGADIPRCGNSPRSRALSAPVSRSAARSASSRAHSCGRRRLVRSALAALLLGCSASVFPGVVLAQGPVGFSAQGIETMPNAVDIGEEASHFSVKVKLSLAPTMDSTVMITNSDTGAVTVSPGSLTFTSETWDTSQSFNITPVQDADANDEFVTLTLSGDELMSTSVMVTIIDDDRKLALTPPAVTVTEGGTATFAVRLALLPGRDTIVAVSSGNTGAATVDLPSLTFTSETWNTAQTVTVTGVQDTDTSNEQVTITLSGDGVETGTVTVDVTDNDTAQVTGVTVDAGDAQLVVTWTAVDNATGYTVQWKLGGQDYNTDDRQATVTSGTTITGLTNGTAYLVQVIATRTGANDGLPSAEVTGTPAVPTGEGVITVSTTTLTVTEADTTGGSYTVVLDSRPTADVTVTVAGYAGTDVTLDPGTLTFTTSNWDTVQTVTVTAGDDVDTTDDSVTLTHSAASTDTGYSGITIAGVVVTVRDNDTAQVTGVTVDAGDAQLVVTWTAVDNATGYTVQWKLGGQDYNTDDRQATVTSGTTITGLTNGTAYLVQVIATRTGANDGLPSAEVTGTPAVPTGEGVITVSTTTLTVTEADTTGGSYTVVLDSRPTADVTVTVAGYAGTDVTLDPGTLTFTTSNWDTVQTVTVTAGDDVDTTDDSVTLTHSAASTDTGYSGITIAGVVVTVRDNDTAQVTGVTVDAGDAQLVVTWTAVDNATGYTVQWKLGGQDYNTDDRQATVTSGTTITGLTNGTAYLVQVIATRTGANDGLPSAEVTGTPAVPTGEGVITVSTTTLTVTEADTTGGSYTVVLDSRPTADVTVTVAGYAGTDVTLDPGTLTFTTSNWDTVQTVTVTAGDDVDTTDDSVTLTHSAASTDTGYSGITIAGVVVTVRDNDTAQVTGVTVDAGDAQLVVTWTAVDNATGYTVQWKSGGQGYNTDDRQATVTSGSTTSHTIEGLANGTAYTVRVSATRTDAADGPPSAETTEMIPTPTPTLPEIALLLLAMLLLGSGVYLLRGRQSGGLTHT